MLVQFNQASSGLLTGGAPTGAMVTQVRHVAKEPSMRAGVCATPDISASGIIKVRYSEWLSMDDSGRYRDIAIDSDGPLALS